MLVSGRVFAFSLHKICCYRIVHCTMENYVLFYIYIALKLNMILSKKAWTLALTNCWTRTSSMNQFSFTRSILTWPLPFRNLNLWFLFSNVFKGQIPFSRLAWVLILVMPARAGGKNTGILGTCHGTWKPKKIKSLMQKPSRKTQPGNVRNPCDIPLCWLVQRDHYNGLL